MTFCDNDMARWRAEPMAFWSAGLPRTRCGAMPGGVRKNARQYKGLEPRYTDSIRTDRALALQLLFLKASESMGNHDSEVVGACSVD
jgi:hypothetical protein